MTQKERYIKGKMADKISYRHLKLQRVCHRAMFIWLYGKKGLKKKREFKTRKMGDYCTLKLA